MVAWLVGSGVLLHLLCDRAHAGEPQPGVLDLRPADYHQLAETGAVWGQETVDGRERAWSARVVDAAPDEVWGWILDYGAYDDTWPYVTRSTLDHVRNEDGDAVYECTIHLLVRGVITRFDFVSRVHPGERRMDFVATPAGPGPVHAVEGWWRVDDVPDEPGRALVVYALDVDVEWWVPGLVRNLASRRGIPLVLDTLARKAHGEDNLAVSATK